MELRAQIVGTQRLVLTDEQAGALPSDLPSCRVVSAVQVALARVSYPGTGIGYWMPRPTTPDDKVYEIRSTPAPPEHEYVWSSPRPSTIAPWYKGEATLIRDADDEDHGTFFRYDPYWKPPQYEWTIARSQAGTDYFMRRPAEAAAKRHRLRVKDAAAFGEWRRNAAARKRVASMRAA